MEPKQSVSANLGLPFTETLNGSQITVNLLDQARQGYLEDMLIALNRKLIEDDKKFRTDAEYTADRALLRKEITSGAYSFGTDLMDGWLKTFPGMAALLDVCTGKPATEWLALLKGPMQKEVGKIIARIWTDSFPNS